MKINCIENRNQSLLRSSQMGKTFQKKRSQQIIAKIALKKGNQKWSVTDFIEKKKFKEITANYCKSCIEKKKRSEFVKVDTSEIINKKRKLHKSRQCYKKRYTYITHIYFYNFEK